MAASVNWIKQLFSSLDKVFDILNVGRLLFYTAGGLLVTCPLVMTVTMLGSLSRSPSAGHGGFFSILHVDLEGWLVVFIAVVAGFMLANVAFTLLVTPGYARVYSRYGDPFPNELSFNYQYPFLKDKKNADSEDYEAWLVSEYFRFVEIASIIPLGLFVGVGLLGLHTLIYLLVDVPERTVADLANALVFLNVVAVALALMRYHLWPRFWRPRVFDQTIHIYMRAKINLIHGVRAVRADDEAT